MAGIPAPANIFDTTTKLPDGLRGEVDIGRVDVVNAMEERGIIASLYEWKRLRNIRNALMHGYPEYSSLPAEALTLAVSGAEEILAVLNRLRD